MVAIDMTSLTGITDESSLYLNHLTGARYLVPAGASVAYARVPVDDGIGSVRRPDLVEPRLTERLARSQHASAHRLAAELDDDVAVLPTHGFGSFCSSTQARGRAQHHRHGEDVQPGSGQGRGDVRGRTAGRAGRRTGVLRPHGPGQRVRPGPVDLTPAARADSTEIARRLAAGEWVVDPRSRVAFAERHVAGPRNFEGQGQLATYLAWTIPWGKPVTLLARTPEEIAAAQRKLARVGIDRPAAAAIGSPDDWVAPGDEPRSYRRATFVDLAAAREAGLPITAPGRDRRGPPWITTPQRPMWSGTGA